MHVLARRLIAAAIVTHFVLILLVVTHVEGAIAKSPALRPLSVLIDYYSAVTFTNRNFGFFAPEVTSDRNVRLIMTDDQGRSRPYVFAFPSAEMKVKSYALFGHFAESEENKDLFSRSWAVKAMNDNPDVVQVDVHVSVNDLPTMEEYRHGQRVEPLFFYRTTLDLR